MSVVYASMIDQYIGLFLYWGGIQYKKRPMYWSTSMNGIGFALTAQLYSDIRWELGIHKVWVGNSKN